MITLEQTDGTEFCELCEDSDAVIKIVELERCLCSRCARKLARMLLQEG